VTPVLLGTQSEADVTAQLAKISGVIDLTGQTKLYDIPDLARRAVVAIGNDTGPMHMASVAKCPVVMMFNTTSSTVEKHGPLGETVKTLEAKNLSAISVEDVLKAYQSVRRI
jgi:ADP-heptose:LPS heptosyltransferase